MTSDLLVLLRGKDLYPAPRLGKIVALVFDEDAGPSEPAANSTAHLGAAGKSGQMQSSRLCLANARKGEITAYVMKRRSTPENASVRLTQ